MNLARAGSTASANPQGSKNPGDAYGSSSPHSPCEGLPLRPISPGEAEEEEDEGDYDYYSLMERTHFPSIGGPAPPSAPSSWPQGSSDDLGYPCNVPHLESMYHPTKPTYSRSLSIDGPYVRPRSNTYHSEPSPHRIETGPYPSFSSTTTPYPAAGVNPPTTTTPSHPNLRPSVQGSDQSYARSAGTSFQAMLTPSYPIPRFSVPQGSNQLNVRSPWQGRGEAQGSMEGSASVYFAPQHRYLQQEQSSSRTPQWPPGSQLGLSRAVDDESRSSYVVEQNFHDRRRRGDSQEQKYTMIRARPTHSPDLGSLRLNDEGDRHWYPRVDGSGQRSEQTDASGIVTYGPSLSMASQRIPQYHPHRPVDRLQRPTLHDEASNAMEPYGAAPGYDRQGQPANLPPQSFFGPTPGSGSWPAEEPAYPARRP